MVDSCDDFLGRYTRTAGLTTVAPIHNASSKRVRSESLRAVSYDNEYCIFEHPSALFIFIYTHMYIY